MEIIAFIVWEAIYEAVNRHVAETISGSVTAEYSKFVDAHDIFGGEDMVELVHVLNNGYGNPEYKGLTIVVEDILNTVGFIDQVMSRATPDTEEMAVLAQGQNFLDRLRRFLVAVDRLIMTHTVDILGAMENAHLKMRAA